MRNKTVNAKLLWMQFEDVLAPRLGLTVWDRAVYSHLLRHSLVVGKLRLHFAVMSVARDLGLSNGPVRQAVRRLDERGALRLLERSKIGHLVEMRLPQQIRTLRPAKGDTIAPLPRPSSGHSPARRGRSFVHRELRGATRHFLNGASQAAQGPPLSALDSTDFLKTWALRKTIHDRERGACFYCLRRTPANVQCLDHVVPFDLRSLRVIVYDKNEPDWGVALQESITKSIKEIIESPLESVLPTFLSVKAGAKPKGVSAKDKTILEMKRDIDLLRMELNRNPTIGRSPLRSSGEAEHLLQRYMKMGMPPEIIESNMVERGAPRPWVRDRLRGLFVSRNRRAIAKRHSARKGSPSRRRG